MSFINIKSGDRIQIKNRSGTLLVKNVEKNEEYVNLGCLLDNEWKEMHIKKSDLDQVKVLGDAGYDLKGNAKKLFLAVEKKRIELASFNSPLINMQNIHPVPHQIEAVYSFLLSYRKIRHLLAHDAGAGKTIMTGLVIKELKARKAIQRYCIVVPGKLVHQWRREMMERFGEKLTIIDGSVIKNEYGDNAWNTSDSLICSMDFAKRNDNRHLLERANEFDLVIVDEAHRMSATRKGKKTTRTGRYILGETFSEKCKHLLFLTATPHKGDPENFKMLMDLLIKDFAGSDMMNDVKNNNLVLRKSKEQMIDMDGNKLFKPRYVETRNIQLEGIEKEIYDNITNYIQDAYLKAESHNNKNALTFAMVQLQKRTASSMMAIYNTLKRRKVTLISKCDSNESEEVKKVSEEALDDMSEYEREKFLEKLEGADANLDSSGRYEEIKELDVLIDSIKEFMDNNDDAKLRDLHDLIKEIDVSDPDAKLLIFTESRETMQYITNKIIDWGYSVSNIHGTMNSNERINKEKEFHDTTRVMVATEAAGEGINLQFCHYMVNYDMPWNPNVLEQRMGRIHRYGQLHDVYVYNLVAGNTREGRVLSKLFEKLTEIKKEIGKDVFDVIGNVVSFKTLDELFREAIAGRCNDRIVVEKIEKDIENYKKIIKSYNDNALVPLNINDTKKVLKRAEDMGLTSKYISNAFIIAVKEAGGRIRNNHNGSYNITIPRSLRNDQVTDNYKGARFVKDDQDEEAILLRFGEPLFDNVFKWIESECMGELKHGAVFESDSYDGYILFHECVFEDGNWEHIDKRMLAHYVDLDGNVELVPPYVLGHLKPVDEANSSVNTEEILKSINITVTESMQNYKPEIRERIKRNADIKERDLKFIKHDILDLDRRLGNEGSNDDKIKQLKESKLKILSQFKEDIEHERNIHGSSPKLITMVRVVPAGKIESSTDDRDVVEKAGMDYVMEYEKQKGYKVTDVSKKNLGWDIESVEGGYDNKKLIEVKSLSGTGQIRMSYNEFLNAAKHGKDYYLYVVSNALSDDIELTIVRDPVSNIDMDEQIGYSIPFKNLRGDAT